MAIGEPSSRKGLKTSNTQCQIDADEMDNQPVPPDGGWGWVVVFGSFMIHIITDGMTYSFGLFYTEFLTYFNEGKGYTAWIVSIMVGVTFASGPISSSFVNRYGCRAVTISGAILAAACMVVSVFAKNVLTLIFTIGIGTGLGLGLIYLPAIVSVTTYFEKKRSLATGIAVCGSGFGTFLFAPLTEFLISNYGWRGAMLIIGGIVLNCIIFGAMFRPLQPPKPATRKMSANIDKNTTSAELQPLKGPATSNEQLLQLPQRNDATLLRSNSVGHGYVNKNAFKYKTFSSDNSLELQNNNANGEANGKQKIANAAKSTSTTDIVRAAVSQPMLSQARDKPRDFWGSGTMYRADALYQGSLHNIPENKRSVNDISGGAAMSHYGSLKHCPTEEVENYGGCCSCSQETRDTFAEMMNFSLLRDVIFIIFALSNFCTSIGFNMPYVYIVEQADTLKISNRDSSYLIAVIGIANTVGRIVLGYISDKPWVNRLWVYNWCLTACGIATALCPLCTDIWTLGIYCAVFGFTIGAYVGLTSVILVDLLGLDKLTNAFGLLLLFQGVASLIGPPIGGWLFDATLSYAPAFILAGVMIAISGLVMFLIPPLQRYQAEKAEQKNAQQMTLS